MIYRCFTLLLFCVLYFQSARIYAQNLVPNGGFEQFTNCPNGDGQLGNADPWNSARGTCDLYNDCDNGNYGVPNNQIGYQNARTGSGYAGFFVSQGWTEVREYLQIQLDNPLEAGVEYCVKFYVCLGDDLNSFGEETFDLAVNNLGVYFTASSYTPDPSNFDHIDEAPQVVNDPSIQLLTDTLNWMKIEGQFVAAGGEEFMLIGSFEDESGQHTTPLGPWGGDNKWSYYLVDDVSVTNCDCEGISLSAAITNETCQGSNGQIELDADGGEGPYSFYLQQNGIDIDSSLNNNSDVIYDSLIAGEYYILLIDSSGCEYDTIINLENSTFPELSINIIDATCERANGSIEIVSLNGDSLSFSWNDNNSNILNNLSNGSYAVTITDQNGCELDTLLNVLTTQKPDADITINPSPPYQINTEINLSDNSNPNANGASSHYWIFSNGYENNTANFTYSLDSPEDLLLTYIITNSDGCSDTIHVTIQVENNISVPNVITMNDDGVNDVFVIHHLNTNLTNELVILNRWGNIIYESKNYQNDWKPENLSDGVYFYKLKQTGENGDTMLEVSGFLHIISSN